MIGTRYIDALDTHLLAFMNNHECAAFQQNSAPLYKAKEVTKRLQAKNINVLQWPGNSPDLNPIENLWTLIKKKSPNQIQGAWETKTGY